mmetsp:Transcript_17020/g.22820  ORF Transcript_17020/g.22820 Transcript_17020/m.22820 type:complete len:143 (-) Transcript_17020:31-459(-)
MPRPPPYWNQTKDSSGKTQGPMAGPRCDQDHARYKMHSLPCNNERTRRRALCSYRSNQWKQLQSFSTGGCQVKSSEETPRIQLARTTLHSSVGNISSRRGDRMEKMRTFTFQSRQAILHCRKQNAGVFVRTKQPNTKKVDVC